MKNTFSSTIKQSLAGRSSPAKGNTDAPKADATKNKQSEKTSESVLPTESETDAGNEKHPGGRPTHESKGLVKRKQYTLTMTSDMYKKTLEKAHSEDLSLAKYVERALIEYEKNHSSQ